MAEPGWFEQPVTKGEVFNAAQAARLEIQKRRDKIDDKLHHAMRYRPDLWEIYKLLSEMEAAYFAQFATNIKEGVKVDE